MASRHRVYYPQQTAEAQLGKTKLTDKRWHLTVDLSNRDNSQIEVAVNNNQIEIQGQYTTNSSKEAKTFKGSYKIPDGYVCSSTNQTESKFTVNAVRQNRQIEVPVIHVNDNDANDDANSGIWLRLRRLMTGY
uniref:SHSP domain-containing protein n=1 Tax=Strigamia maritima TaxID=126957 RepID=T1IWE2_STRMM